MKTTTDNEDILQLQIGVLTSAVALLCQHAGKDLVLNLKLSEALNKLPDIMESRSCSDLSIQLARETAESIILGLPSLPDELNQQD